MGKLYRLTEKIVNKPQLMEASALADVIQILAARNDGVVELAISGGRERQAKELGYDSTTGIGLLSIDGPLTYLEYSPMCGAEPSSYQRLTSEFKALVDAGAKTIVLDVDSPGGEAYACFETAKSLRQMADDASVKLIAYVDGMAASAAYGLSCVADEIIINPMAEVGSIGVVVGLTNVSKAERKMGVTRTFVYAGDSKIPFDAKGNFTEAFLGDIQNKVDNLYGQFVSHVAEARGLTPEMVAGTQAKVFTAEKAVELGLADAIMTVAEFQDYLHQIKMGTTMPIGNQFKLNKGATDMAANAELEAQVASLTAEAVTSVAALEAVTAQVASLSAQLEEVVAAKTELESQLAAYQAAAEEAQASAAELALAARKASLVDAVGADKAETLFASLSALDDTAYAAVVETFASAKAVADESVLFVEQGVGADGNLASDAGLELVGRFIQQNKSRK